MKIFIPRLKDKLKLNQEWTFTLYPEYRNRSLFKLKSGINLQAISYKKRREVGPIKVTLPIGTELIIDRIYIREGNESFNSVTFRSAINEKNVRFWVKLDEFNGIDCELTKGKGSTKEYHYVEKIIDDSDKPNSHRIKYYKSSSKSALMNRLRKWNQLRPIFAKIIDPILLEKYFITKPEYSPKLIKDGYDLYREQYDTYNKAFDIELRKHIKVSKWEDLLDHLPEGYEYKVIKR